MNNRIDPDVGQTFMERYGFKEIKYYYETMISKFDHGYIGTEVERAKYEITKTLMQRFMDDDYLIIKMNRDYNGDMKINFEFRVYVLSRLGMDNIFSPQLMAERYGGIVDE